MLRSESEALQQWCMGINDYIKGQMEVNELMAQHVAKLVERVDELEKQIVVDRREAEAQIGASNEAIGRLQLRVDALARSAILSNRSTHGQ